MATAQLRFAFSYMPKMHVEKTSPLVLYTLLEASNKLDPIYPYCIPTSIFKPFCLDLLNSDLTLVHTCSSFLLKSPQILSSFRRPKSETKWIGIKSARISPVLHHSLTACFNVRRWLDIFHKESVEVNIH